MNENRKPFAFALATHENGERQSSQDDKWQARDGVALAGCTDPTGQYMPRYSSRFNPDGGVFC